MLIFNMCLECICQKYHPSIFNEHKIINVLFYMFNTKFSKFGMFFMLTTTF